MYYVKGESIPKHSDGFKRPLVFYKNIRDGYTIEKAEEDPIKKDRI